MRVGRRRNGDRAALGPPLHILDDRVAVERLVRHGEQYELTLQAETFAVGGAKIQVDEDAEGRGITEVTVRGV